MAPIVVAVTAALVWNHIDTPASDHRNTRRAVATSATTKKRSVFGKVSREAQPPWNQGSSVKMIIGGTRTVHRHRSGSWADNETTPTRPSVANSTQAEGVFKMMKNALLLVDADGDSEKIVSLAAARVGHDVLVARTSSDSV